MKSALRRMLAEIFWDYEHGVADKGDDGYRARLAEATERDIAQRASNHRDTESTEEG